MNSFSTLYPNLSYWIESQGYMQLGIDDDSPISSLLTLIDAGGVVWQDESSETLDEALNKAEAFLGRP